MKLLVGCNGGREVSTGNGIFLFPRRTTGALIACSFLSMLPSSLTVSFLSFYRVTVDVPFLSGALEV